MAVAEMLEGETHQQLPSLLRRIGSALKSEVELRRDLERKVTALEQEQSDAAYQESRDRRARRWGLG